MADNTRQTIVQNERNPKSHLDAGYENSDIPDDFSIPSCGLEDVDKAVHNLFDKEIGFQSRSASAGSKNISLNKPFVIFATGERFALAKKLRPIRNKDGALILPAIAIRRTGVKQTSEDTTGRGMNQTTGTISITRRFNPSDRDYQGFINKLGLKNTNLPDTRRTTGSLDTNSSLETNEGLLLYPNYGNNIWETITIPQPQFWTQTYEITFWTNYTENMNYLIETLYSSFLPQDKMFKLTTDKGYWFIGYVDDELTSNENFDDFTEQDRIIRYSFNLSVKSFLLAANGPGNKVPIRREISSPNIVFDITETKEQVFDEKQLPQNLKASSFTLTDIDQLEEDSQEKTTLQKMLVNKEVFNAKTGKTEVKTVRILETNQKSGETVYYSSGVSSLEELVNLMK